MANRLINSTSPYLLQHAHNPVDWYEWGSDALEKASKEDKPILVSIGYSSCHWCHVMERESFEKENIAEVMNKFFVCIKVDREERPDIDQVYMEAVQIMGVNGGWPLNVFLTPDQKPFFGGTYFTPQVWVEVLNNINRAYRGNRQQIEDSAEEIRMHLQTPETSRYKQTQSVNTELMTDMNEMYQKLQSRFDHTLGGIEKEPKFIMPSIWLFLLRYAHLTKNNDALQHVIFTLKKIAMGGIYDQVGGGFARYSVDRYWFAPHFEKMLYDNAQLLSLYSEAYAVTRDDFFKTIVDDTFNWLLREMKHPHGGFYSALDADSEGVEGKFYVWTQKELKEILSADEPLISSYFGVKENGNWEHGANILIRPFDDDQFLKANGLNATQWQAVINKTKATLLEHRSKRIWPGLDDKIITGWNAMTACGLIDAYRTFADKRFLQAAIDNVNFIEKELKDGMTLYRSFKEKRSLTTGFLEDYAYFIQALTKLYQVTFHEKWIMLAAEMLEHTIAKFFDPSDGYFFYTASDAEQLISRKKEMSENVIPSSNALMAQNLHHLGVIFDRAEWKQMAVAMTDSFAHLIKNEPGYMSQWAIAFIELKKGMAEVVLTGKNLDALRQDLVQHYLPFAIVQGSEKSSELPLVKDKIAVQNMDTIYVCYNNTCKLPVHTIEEAKLQML